MSSLKDKTAPDCRTWLWYKLGREIEPAQAVPISRPDCSGCKNQIPLVLTPNFIDCRSPQSRSCP